ncbi:hypothetical protein HYV73_00275 [Candidatus Uhrbacteria bacterium]|nr:hypothetical protein [Candidatus Uhrbacteria bacterium]
MTDNQKIDTRYSDEEIRKLVVARLSVLSSDMQISIGSSGTFTRDELIGHVNANDDLGRKIEEIELEWLRSWKDKAHV